MVVIKVIGGLGNQLFQYALGRAIEIKLGYKVKYDICDFKTYKLRNFELDKFKTKFELSSKFENILLRNIISKSLYKIHSKFPSYISIRILNYYLESEFKFVNNLFEIPESIYLSGYWQSEKYFREIKNVLIDELILKNQPSVENSKYLQKITNSNSVSIHIRRGDYIEDISTNNIHGFCGLNYYNKSISTIESQINDPTFFVFSDDINWAKNNIRSKFTIYFVDINSDKPEEDLRLMSNCKHNIIANSSFSWWAAWLNPNINKIVIAPQLWFANQYKNSINIVPIDWIKI
jgi:hypothetical protein